MENNFRIHRLSGNNFPKSSLYWKIFSAAMVVPTNHQVPSNKTLLPKPIFNCIFITQRFLIPYLKMPATRAGLHNSNAIFYFYIGLSFTVDKNG